MSGPAFTLHEKLKAFSSPHSINLYCITNFFHKRPFFSYVKLQVTWGCNTPAVMNVRLSNMNGYKWMCQLRHIVISTKKRNKRIKWDEMVKWPLWCLYYYFHLKPLRKIVNYFHHTCSQVFSFLKKYHLPYVHTLRNKLQKYLLADVAQWIEHRTANKRVASSIPTQGTCLGCGSGS